MRPRVRRERYAIAISAAMRIMRLAICRRYACGAAARGGQAQLASKGFRSVALKRGLDLHSIGRSSAAGYRIPDTARWVLGLVFLLRAITAWSKDP